MDNTNTQEQNAPAAPAAPATPAMPAEPQKPDKIEDPIGKEANPALIAGIITGVIALIVVIFAVFVLPNITGGGEGGEGGGIFNGASKKVKEANDMPVIEKYDRHEKDLIRIVNAANSYISDNGVTPWSTGATDTKFVRNYIDNTCLNETPDEADITCGSTNFRDQDDGVPYHFVYSGSPSKIMSVGFDFDHGIRVYTGAVCRERDNTIEPHSSQNYFALIYRTFDNKYFCRSSE